jgi:hypothetical protein
MLAHGSDKRILCGLCDLCGSISLSMDGKPWTYGEDEKCCCTQGEGWGTPSALSQDPDFSRFSTEFLLQNLRSSVPESAGRSPKCSIEFERFSRFRKKPRIS